MGEVEGGAWLALEESRMGSAGLDLDGDRFGWLVCDGERDFEGFGLGAQP